MIAAYLVAGVALFVVYLRLSQTYALNSDSANILLMASDLLHGHLLLHGWYMSDVSFYPTELPQYALLESFLGLHMQTGHIAGGDDLHAGVAVRRDAGQGRIVRRAAG